MSNTESDKISLTIQSGQEISGFFKDSFKGQAESTCRVTPPKSLSGEAPTYLLVATLALKELPVILTRLRDLVDSLPIRKAEIDGVKYENISSKELKKLLEDRSKRGRHAPKSKNS